MKVTKQQVNVLIMVLGVVIIALTYFYGVQKLNEKTEALEAENGQLRNEINTPGASAQTEQLHSRYRNDEGIVRSHCGYVSVQNFDGR